MPKAQEKVLKDPIMTQPIRTENGRRFSTSPVSCHNNLYELEILEEPFLHLVTFC